MLNILRSKDFIFYIILFLIICFFLYFRQIFYGYHYDDSFITYRYAINLSQGKGFVFNYGERVNSASSLLFTLVLSFFHFVGFKNISTISTIIGISSALSSIYLVYSFVLNYIPDKILRACILVPFIFSGSVIAWATSGMETLFFMFLILVFFKFYLNKNLYISGLLLCLLLFCRPESIIIFATILIVESFHFIKTKETLNLFVYFIFGFSTIFIFYFWNYIYFDNIVPQPVRFKKISPYYSLSLDNSVKNVFYFFFIKNCVLSCLSFFTIIIYTYNYVKRRRIFPEEKTLLTFTIYFVLSIMSFIIGPYSDFHRYMVHTIPIMVFISSMLVNRHLNIFKNYKSIQYLTILFSLVYLVRDNKNIASYFYKSSLHQEYRIELGKYINSNLDKSELIMSSDLGAISFFAINNNFVDIAGLTSLYPFKFIDKSQVHYISKWIKNKKVKYVADTQYGEKTSSLEVLKTPSLFFKTVNSNFDFKINLYDISNSVIFKKSVDSNMSIVLLKINDNLYKN